MIQWRNSENKFGWVGRTLHWCGVALAIAIYIGISGLDVPPKVFERESVIATHNALGLIFLALICTRFVWRQVSLNPVRGWRLKKGHEQFIVGLHRTLYFLVLAVCVSGILSTVGTTPEYAKALHNTFAYILLASIATHAAMALFNLLVAPAD